MSRLYPIRGKVGWMRRKAREFSYRVHNWSNGRTQFWTPENEREPETGAPVITPTPRHVGYVLRNSIYVSNGRRTRRKP